MVYDYRKKPVFTKTEIFYYPDTKIPHCETGPAVSMYNADGVKIREEYYIKGKYHRIAGPAFIERYDNGNIRREIYYVDGEMHRLDGPAEVIFTQDGIIVYENYRIGGRAHRENGPAIIKRDGRGFEYQKEWYVNGKKHNRYGPAFVYKTYSRKKTFTSFWLDGSQVAPNQFPFTKILREKRLYSKWVRNELTEEELMYIKMIMD